MSFIGNYSKKLVSGRQKLFLTAAVTACVTAFVYTYLVTEFITHSLLVSIADNTPHIRLTLSQSEAAQTNQLLAEIRKMPEVERADSGISVTKEFYVTTRKLPTEFGKPGEVFYTGIKKFQFTGYAFDSVDYRPPVLMENVYSSMNRERMESRPEDEPVKILTDPSETEQRENWVIIEKSLNDIFPYGASVFGDLFELNFTDADGKQQIIPLRTAGFLTGSPLNISHGESLHQIYTKKIHIEKFTLPEERTEVIDIALKNRELAVVLAEKLKKDLKIESIETWTDMNASAVPFLEGLKMCTCIGAFAIVFMSIIGVFIIISMIAIDKTHQLAILYAMGLEAIQLRILFLLIGIRTAVWALALGFSGAFLAGILSIPYWSELVSNFCTVQKMSLIYSANFLGIFAGITFLLCSLAAWIPTRFHVSQDPIRNLRSE